MHIYFKNLFSKNTVYFRIALLASALLGLLACSNAAQTPAPVGDHAVLEQLADAYRSVSQQYPMQPQAMPPKGRREFVDQVFLQAGYGYSATLVAMSQAGTDITNQDQRDLVELLLLPNKGLSDEDIATIYNADEAAAVRRLRADFR